MRDWIWETAPPLSDVGTEKKRRDRFRSVFEKSIELSLQLNDDDDQCDQTARLFDKYLAVFNKENLPNLILNLPNTKWTYSKWPKFINVVLETWNFAKSGHTDNDDDDWDIILWLRYLRDMPNSSQTVLRVLQSQFLSKPITVWPVFAKFRHFGKLFKLFGNVLRVI